MSKGKKVSSQRAQKGSVKKGSGWRSVKGMGKSSLKPRKSR